MIKRLQAIRKRGFNLIEAAIVLGVVGAVVGGIWVAASRLYDSYTAKKFASNILLIVEGTKSLFPKTIWPSEPSGWTDISYTAVAAGIVPKDMVKENSIINPYSGKSFVLRLLYPPLTRRTIYVNIYTTEKSVAEKTILALLSGKPDIWKAYCASTTQYWHWGIDQWPPICPESTENEWWVVLYFNP